MRRIPLSLISLFAPVACVVACSSPPTTLLARHSDPAASSSPPSSATDTTSLSLVGDGHALHLNGAPADPSYVATYPLAGFTGMTIHASLYGDLTAGCQSGGGAAACTTLPFFTSVSGNPKEVKVYDAYGHMVMVLPALPASDAGTSTPAPSPVGDASTSDAGDDDASSVGVGGGTSSGGATSCAPSVTASLAGCSITIGGTTCDCCDASCAATAIESCLNLPSLPSLPGSTGGGVGSLFDGGLPGLPSLPSLDAGGASSACSSAAIASAQATFCSDVNAFLTAHNVSATLDCSSLGTLSFPASAPPASSSGVTCDDAIHDAFVKVRADLATCDPLDYIGWNSSAQLQLFDDGACTVW